MEISCFSFGDLSFKSNPSQSFSLSFDSNFELKHNFLKFVILLTLTLLIPYSRPSFHFNLKKLFAMTFLFISIFKSYKVFVLKKILHRQIYSSKGVTCSIRIKTSQVFSEKAEIQAKTDYFLISKKS